MPNASPSAAREVTYVVAEMSCAHCVAAVTDELQRVAGVQSVAVDLAAKLVDVKGVDLDERAVIAAIDDAGYDAVAA